MCFWRFHFAIFTRFTTAQIRYNYLCCWWCECVCARERYLCKKVVRKIMFVTINICVCDRSRNNFTGYWRLNISHYFEWLHMPHIHSKRMYCVTLDCCTWKICALPMMTVAHLLHFHCDWSYFMVSVFFHRLLFFCALILNCRRLLFIMKTSHLKCSRWFSI